MKRTKTLEDYQNILRKLAWSFHYTTGLEWEELYGEACLAYVQAMRDYDTERAAVSTWLYCVVRNHLIRYAKKCKPPQLPEIGSRVLRVTPEDIAIFRQAVLPSINGPWKGACRKRDIFTLVSLVFRSPGDYLGGWGERALAERLSRLGWSNQRIKDTLQAVKKAI